MKTVYLFTISAAFLMACQSPQPEPNSANWPSTRVKHGWAVFSGPKPTAISAEDSTSVARGQKIYEKNCSGCHGDTGSGNGPIAKIFDVNAANLRGSPKNLKHYITMQINNGRADMPEWKNLLSEQELIDVTNYVLSLK